MRNWHFEIKIWIEKFIDSIVISHNSVGRLNKIYIIICQSVTLYVQTHLATPFLNIFQPKRYLWTLFDQGSYISMKILCNVCLYERLSEQTFVCRNVCLYESLSVRTSVCMNVGLYKHLSVQMSISRNICQYECFSVWTYVIVRSFFCPSPLL